MPYFPMYRNLSSKKCVIAGGGAVALRKVKNLLRFGADVQVFAPQISEEIEHILPKDTLHYKKIEQKEIEGAELVIAATNQREVNHQISLWCEEFKVPVNVIDSPEESTFLFPSFVMRGDICIGINTAGQSPIVSKKIRKRVEKAIPEEYADIAVQLGEVKRYGKEHISDEKKRKQILTVVAEQAFEKERALTKNELQECLGELYFNIEGK